MALPPVFRPIFAGIGVVAGGSAVLCKIMLHEATTTMWGYSAPEVFDPWIQGIGISTAICLLAFLVAICPWCYRKDACTAHPTWLLRPRPGLAGDRSGVTPGRRRRGRDMGPSDPLNTRTDVESILELRNLEAWLKAAPLLDLSLLQVTEAEAADLHRAFFVLWDCIRFARESCADTPEEQIARQQGHAALSKALRRSRLKGVGGENHEDVRGTKNGA